MSSDSSDDERDRMSLARILINASSQAADIANLLQDGTIVQKKAEALAETLKRAAKRAWFDEKESEKRLRTIKTTIVHGWPCYCPLCSDSSDVIREAVGRKPIPQQRQEFEDCRMVSMRPRKLPDKVLNDVFRAKRRRKEQN